jgi:hypothetical protein
MNGILVGTIDRLDQLHSYHHEQTRGQIQLLHPVSHWMSRYPIRNQ